MTGTTVPAKPEALIVLAVEDNPAEARLLRELLSEVCPAPLALIHCARLAEALACAQQGQVDVVLLDLSLPDAHGIDTFRAMHAGAPDLPVVVLTGTDDESLALLAMQEGAQDYLTKQGLDGRLLDRSLRYAVHRKRAELQRLQLAREVAARAQAEAELRARDQFLSVASHELKTPVTVMLGYAQSLLRRARRAPQPDARDLRALDALVAQTRRMARLISALLDLSRLQNGSLVLEYRPVDLGALALRLVEELQPAFSHHKLEFSEPDERLIVEGDELRLEQVLYNLISNAVKYSPDGSAVQIALQHAPGKACLVVSDQGIGIPASALARLGTLYFRAGNADSSSVSGMGIGLYLVKEIAALHRGKLEVESVEGQGTTARVCLPLQALA